MYTTTSLPEKAFKCSHPIEFYKLKPLKRVYYTDNIEMRYGMVYYLFSEEADGYYKRTLTVIDPEELSLDILLGYVYLVYSDEEADEIKKILKRDKIDYRSFLRRCVGEWNGSKLTNKKHDNAYTTKQDIFKGYR